MKQVLMKILHNSPLECSVNTILRYRPIVRKLEKLKRENNNLKVLEIGSGSKGITRFYKHPVIGMDAEFQIYNKNNYLTEVVGDVTKEFAFKDGEFDVVVSVDMIEHIPKKKRKTTFYKEPKKIIESEIKKLQKNFEIIQIIDLKPFDKDHALVVAKYITKN